MTAQLHARRSGGAHPGPSGPDPVELRGWGRNTVANSTVLQPRTVVEIEELVQRCPPPFLGRGLGRAYGDAAAVDGGTVLDLTRCQRTVAFRPGSGLIQVEAGLALDTLMQRVLPLGWIPPVLPGTGRVTLGGALAADVHGKNERTAGTFAQHVVAFELVTSDGRLYEISRERDEAAFLATAGGMGLTGIIASVTLQLQHAETAWVREARHRVGNLSAVFAAVEDSRAEHVAAWIDGFASGSRFGRGEITAVDGASVSDLPAGQQARPYDTPDAGSRYVPARLAGALLRPRLVATANTARWHRARRRGRPQLRDIGPALHPLDRVADWPAWYGRQGFLQYQFVVPDSAQELVADVLQQLARAGHPPYLAVLKRFRRHGCGLLSFPMPGWSLALDLPDGDPGLHRLLDRLDGDVAAAGGRVYLAKDSRLRPDVVETMYPRLPQWRLTRDAMDPGRALRSDLSGRLNLIEGTSTS